LQNCDRILVMNSGRMVAEFAAEEASEDQLYKAMLTSKMENVQ
jgi:simple sugar transport system ATP-binding protein